MISENIARINDLIRGACNRSGRNPADIRVVAVTKTRNIEEVKAVLGLGILDIGESRVQEAFLKCKELTSPPVGQFSGLIGESGNWQTGKLANWQTPKWHMIGHVQTNKVKDAVAIFDLIHSVDSLRLADSIDKEAARISKIQDILIEVKTSPEATKYGVAPEEIAQLLGEVDKLKNIRILGLMTIAPLFNNPEEARPYFRRLKELFVSLNLRRTTSNALLELSMGMSDDFQVAIEEGATMVRIGRAIFS
jgi:PLP dependent protein